MFKENDIRPLDLQEEQKKSLQKDIDFLNANKEDFVMVKCPSCAHESTDVKLTKNGFTYTQCPRCTMLYTNP